jgi:hypothetical protein
MRERYPLMEIAKLEMHEGDRLVVKVHTVLSAEQVEAVKQRFQSQVQKGCEVMVIDNLMSLAVLTKKW